MQRLEKNDRDRRNEFYSSFLSFFRGKFRGFPLAQFGENEDVVLNELACKSNLKPGDDRILLFFSCVW